MGCSAEQGGNLVQRLSETGETVHALLDRQSEHPRLPRRALGAGTDVGARGRAYRAGRSCRRLTTELPIVARVSGVGAEVGDLLDDRSERWSARVGRASASFGHALSPSAGAAGRAPARRQERCAGLARLVRGGRGRRRRSTSGPRRWSRVSARQASRSTRSSSGRAIRWSPGCSRPANELQGLIGVAARSAGQRAQRDRHPRRLAARRAGRRDDREGVAGRARPQGLLGDQSQVLVARIADVGRSVHGVLAERSGALITRLAETGETVNRQIDEQAETLAAACHARPPRRRAWRSRRSRTG